MLVIGFNLLLFFLILFDDLLLALFMLDLLVIEFKFSIYKNPAGLKPKLSKNVQYLAELIMTKPMQLHLCTVFGHSCDCLCAHL